jgi:hypothetical protein
VTEIYDETHALLDADAPVTDRDSGPAYEFAEEPRAPHPAVIELGEGLQAEALRRLGLRPYAETLELT